MKGQKLQTIKFFFLSDNISLPDRGRLKSFLLDLLRREGKKVQFVNLIFCSDEYLLEINKEYLSHDFYTDIITFELSPANKDLEAEIYISTDRVRENAKQLGVSIKEESLRVIFHGLLHLSGYADKTKSEQRVMRQKEEDYLGKYLQ